VHLVGFAIEIDLHNLFCSPLINGTFSTRWKYENRCRIVIVLIAGAIVEDVGVAGGL
jgi:hypothetical protein